MSCTYQFVPSMIHVGYKGTYDAMGNILPVLVSYETQPGCNYYPLTHQNEPWWHNGFELGIVDDLAQTDVQITCQPNPSSNPRMDGITILGGDGGSIQTFVIVQDGQPPSPPTWNTLVESYNAFLTSWLNRFWWWNPPGPGPGPDIR